MAEVAWPSAEDEVVVCGLDHQGESVVAWDAQHRGAAVAERRAGSASARDSVLDRLTDEGLDAEITRRSGLPIDPYFSAAS